MGYAVEMYLDPAAEERVRSVWNELKSAGLDSTMLDIGARPHLSLAVFDDVETPSLCALVEDFAASVVGFSSMFAAVGTFPGDEGVVFLAPAVSSELLALHRSLHERLVRLGQRSWSYYLPGRWVPHCTVGLGLTGSSLAEAISVCRRSAAFGPFEVRELGLIEFAPVTTVCVHGAR
jgi:2'-5' RNA ligase